jgi:hypothetical protein
MNDNRQHNLRRFAEINRTVLLTVTIVSGSLAIYWATKWVRGDPDAYRNQIVGGLTLTTAMTLLTSSQLTRSGKARWTLSGLGAILLVINMVMLLTGLRLSILTLIALLLCAGSIVSTSYVLRPARGVSLAAWRTTPATLEQRRGVCTGMAAFSLGLAVLCLSFVQPARGPWDANAVAAITTLIFLSASVMCVVLRARLRG